MTDRRAARGALARAVEEAVAAGVDRVQVRERGLGGAALLEHVRELGDAARRGAARRAPGHRRDVRLVVNRFLDVALAAGADGVHLGFDAVAPEDAALVCRRAGAPQLWIGVSAHAPSEVGAAARAGAHGAHLAPVFPPLSKPAERPALGLAALSEAAATGLPVWAQGGITAARATDCVRAGAAGVAVTGAILGADDPGRAAAALREALDAGAEA